MNNKCKWIEFRMGQPLFADDARRITAKLVDLAGLDKEKVGLLLHYQDGTPRSGFCPVKFHGTRSGFAIIAVGESAIQALDAVAGPIASAWAVHTMQPVTQDRRAGTCALSPIKFQLQYEVPRICVQKKPHHLEAFTTDPAEHLRRLITKGIRMQSAFVGIDAPEDLAVEVVSWEAGKPARLGHGNAAFATARKVTFRLNARLSGWWSLGHLTAKGYGMLNADLAAALRMEARHAA